MAMVRAACGSMRAVLSLMVLGACGSMRVVLCVMVLGSFVLKCDGAGCVWFYACGSMHCVLCMGSYRRQDLRFLWFCARGSTCDVLCVLCVMFLVVVLAFDLDATGLEGEEAPSSPKASPSTLSSTLGREKRIPFFKKVTTPSKPRPQRPPSSQSAVSLCAAARPIKNNRPLPRTAFLSASPSWRASVANVLVFSKLVVSALVVSMLVFRTPY